MKTKTLMLIALSFFVVMPVFAWWDYDWAKQKQLVITSNDSVHAWNDSVEVNVTGLTLNTSSCLKEPRIVNETSGTIIEYAVVDAGGENETAGSQWCVLRLKDVVVPQDANLTDIYVYYTNPDATNPSYSPIDAIVQGTNLLGNAGFETGDMTNWTEDNKRYAYTAIDFTANSTVKNTGNYSAYGDQYALGYLSSLSSDSVYQCVDYYPQYDYNLSVAVYTGYADDGVQENTAMAFFDLMNSTTTNVHDNILASIGAGDSNWICDGAGIDYGYGLWHNWIIGRVNCTSDTHVQDSSFQTYYTEYETNLVWNWTQWDLTEVVANNLTLNFGTSITDVLYVCAGYAIKNGAGTIGVSGNVDDFAVIPMGINPTTSFGSEVDVDYCGDGTCEAGIGEHCNNCELDCACSGDNFCDWSASQGTFTCQGTYTNVAEETRGFLWELTVIGIKIIVVMSLIVSLAITIQWLLPS